MKFIFGICILFFFGLEGFAIDKKVPTTAIDSTEKVRLAKTSAWKSFNDAIKIDYSTLLSILKILADESPNGVFITKEIEGLEKTIEPIRKDIVSLARKVLRMVRAENSPSKIRLSQWISGNIKENFDRYSSHLHSESAKSALKIEAISPEYDSEITMEDGRIILRDNYRKLLEKFPELLVFGEDAGKIGGVNQTLEGLQDQFGDLRVFDTGIRECTIIGQGIGLAMRGLRPIAEIQYLDYLLYAIQILSDDLATLQYRTKGGQKAPLIISTRGHRTWCRGVTTGLAD